MRRVASRVFSLCVLIFILLHIVRQFLSLDWMVAVQACSAMGLLVSGLLLNARASRTFSLAVSSIGLGMLAYDRSEFGSYLQAFLPLGDIIVLVSLAHVLILLLQIRQYAPHLLGILRQFVRDASQMSIWSSVLTHTIASAGSLTGLLIVYEMLRPGVIGPEPSRLTDPSAEPMVRRLSSAIIRGYALTVLWAPSSVPFATAVSFTGASVLWVMIPGFLLAMCGLAFHAFLERRAGPKSQSHFRWQDTQEAVSLESGQAVFETKPSRVIEFFVVLATIILSIVIISQISSLSLLQVIPLVILSVTVCVLLFSGQIGELFRISKDYVREILPGKNQELVLLTASGILVSAFDQTGTGLRLFELLTRALEPLPIGMPSALAVTILIIGLIGIPPLVITILVATLMDPAMKAMSPELISLSIASAICAGTMLTPNSVPLLVLSGLIQRTPFQAGLRWNLPFAVVFFVFTQIVIEIAWYFR